MNQSSIRVVATAASPLFKPDVRISRIRLSQGHFAERHAPRPSRLGQPAESSPPEKEWQIHYGSKLQVVPFPFCEHMSLAGALRSTGITRRPHYYGPLRLPIKPNIGYLFPISVDTPAHPAEKSLDWASQVPRLICRCPLSPITPGRPVAAYTCCFATDSRLHLLRKDGHDHLCNEAESGSLTLRLTPSPHRASTAGSPRQPPARLHGQQAITMVNTFQQTRSARLTLAHRSHGDIQNNKLCFHDLLPCSFMAKKRQTVKLRISKFVT